MVMNKITNPTEATEMYMIVFSCIDVEGLEVYEEVTASDKVLLVAAGEMIIYIGCIKFNGD